MLRPAGSVYVWPIPFRVGVICDSYLFVCVPLSVSRGGLVWILLLHTPLHPALQATQRAGGALRPIGVGCFVSVGHSDPT